MRRIQLTTSTLAGACLLAALTFAAAGAAGATADDYETIVSAPRIDEDQYDEPHAVEVITSDEADEAHATSLPDAVEQASGVALQRTNRGAGAPIIRGLIGPQNLILIDGVRFNNSIFRTGPNQYLSTFDLGAVDRIEVIRGPSSVMYGDGAMGGVLNLITLAPSTHTPGWHERSRIFFRSADSATGGSLDVFRSGEEFSALAGGSFADMSTLTAGGGLTQPLSGFSTGGWRGRVSYRPEREPVRITGAYFGARVSNAGRADRLGQGDVRFYDNTDHLAYLSVSWTPNDVLRELKGTVSYHRMIEKVQRIGCATDGEGRIVDLPGCVALSIDQIERERRYEDAVDTIGADLTATLALFSDRLELDLGAQVYRDSVSSCLREAGDSEGIIFEKAVRGNFSEGSTYGIIGVFANADLLIWGFQRAGEIRVKGGGRFSAFRAEAPDVPVLGNVKYSHAGGVGSGGLQWMKDDAFNLWGSFSQGFRAPNLQETTVLGSTGSKFEIPNDDLSPERSNTIEAGARLMPDPVFLEAVWFKSYLLDAIDEEPSTWKGAGEIGGAPVVRRVNTAEGLYQGVEGSAALRVWRFTLGGGVTWLEGELTDSDGTYPARRVPPLLGDASLRYDHPGDLFHMGLYLRWAARQDELHPSDEADLRICEDGFHTGVLLDPCRGTPGWYTLSVRSGVRPTETMRIEFELKNLTDRRYKIHGSGFYQPGLSAAATLVLEI